jgi:PadR family transcriptional regulator
MNCFSIDIHYPNSIVVFAGVTVKPSAGRSRCGCYSIGIRFCELTTLSAENAGMRHHDLLQGFIRLHIVHHAAEGEVYGQWIMEELARHGYRLSAGTLYPMLHSLERKGYLRSREKRMGRTARRLYRATAQGRAALEDAKEKLQELVGELIEQR